VRHLASPFSKARRERLPGSTHTLIRPQRPVQKWGGQLCAAVFAVAIGNLVRQVLASRCDWRTSRPLGLCQEQMAQSGKKNTVRKRALQDDQNPECDGRRQCPNSPCSNLWLPLWQFLGHRGAARQKLPRPMKSAPVASALLTSSRFFTAIATQGISKQVGPTTANSRVVSRSLSTGFKHMYRQTTGNAGRGFAFFHASCRLDGSGNRQIFFWLEPAR